MFQAESFFLLIQRGVLNQTRQSQCFSYQTANKHIYMRSNTIHCAEKLYSDK